MKNQSALIRALGLLFFLFTHLLFIDSATGLHYDEAWAANFAAQLSNGQGFSWGLDAMSPYTAAWGHLWAAFIFKLFGMNLWTFRLSGILLCVTGVGAMSAALNLLGLRFAASIFPWIIGAFAPAVINHRFCIDLTSVHVVCFGLLCYGLAKAQVELSRGKENTGAFILIGIALWVGITSHLLFLAPALALLVVLVHRQERVNSYQRGIIVLISGLLLPRLCQIFFKVPEKDKALALLLLDLMIFIWATWFHCKVGLRQKHKDWILKGLLFLTLPGLGFFIFFCEGSWSILFTQGQIVYPLATYVSAVSTVVLVLYLGVATLDGPLNSGDNFALQNYLRSLNRWFLLTLFFLSGMMLKPAPRYFEMGFLMVQLLFAITLERSPRFYRRSFLAVYFIASLSQLIPNYYMAGIKEQGTNATFGGRFLKDRSTDSLSQFALIRELGQRGCTLKNVDTHNPRLAEGLKFLSLGDWKVEPAVSCPASVRVEVYEDIPLMERGGYRKVGEYGVKL